MTLGYMYSFSVIKGFLTCSVRNLITCFDMPDQCWIDSTDETSMPRSMHGARRGSFRARKCHSLVSYNCDLMRVMHTRTAGSYDYIIQYSSP